LAANVRTLDVSSALDRTIFETTDWWRKPEVEQVADRVAFLRSAVEHHLESCALYGAYAARRGFDAATLDRREALATVPQIPTTVFKRVDVLSVPRRTVVHSFTSSGTTGVQSQVLRDEPTLARLAGSLRPDLEVWSDVFDERDVDEGGEVVNLGPGRAEASGLWFSYVMSLVEQFAPATNCVHGGRLDLDLAADRIRSGFAGGRLVCVVGPPVLVAALCRRIAPERLAGGANALVITGGGWKRAAVGEVLDREAFTELVVEALGLERREQVRDVFNQVELNTLFVECGRGRLHVPPWVEVIVRHPDTLEPVQAGELGVLSYLDASAQSYPCFILSEDLGWTWPETCACGRVGQTVAISRRIDTAAHQGCSLKLLETVRLSADDLKEDDRSSTAPSAFGTSPGGGGISEDDCSSTAPSAFGTSPGGGGMGAGNGGLS
jgi:long-chain-fatty-acid---luciferin-component ligase